MIKTGIIGGTGYTAGELIRLLIIHPETELVFVNSSSNAGNKLTAVHAGIYGETDMTFTSRLPLNEIDLLFFCTAHGETNKFLENTRIPEKLKIIDLSQDYRLDSPTLTPEIIEVSPDYADASLTHAFIYGLPELNRQAIYNSKYVANPGCFATGIQLALLPLAKHRMLNNSIHVNAITGSTGAGVKPSTTSHFSWRNNNISVYKPFEHQHLAEIRQSLKQLQPDFHSDINLIPVRGDFTRGIFTTAYMECQVEIDEIQKIYRDYYNDHPFTIVVDENPDLKQIINTNKCLLYLRKIEGKLLVISVIDNLLKGASGQAVQNMNLLFGLEETAGLHLKGSSF